MRVNESATEVSTLFGQTFRRELEEDDKQTSFLKGNRDPHQINE